MDIENIEVEKKLRIVFMGTPEFSVPILDALIKNYGVKAVITQPDKQVGRSGEICESPIKKLAKRNNILVIQLQKVKTQYQEIIELEPDIIITCAYGQILPKELLDYPKYGCINVHASLLPKLRGGAPIHRAIMNGNDKTGITIMYMAVGMDDGDIIEQREIPILNTDTTEVLHDKLSKLGSQLLIETLPSIINGTNKRIKQNSSEVTFAPIIKPEDEKIDFNKTSLQIYNQIRGLNSFPGAYTILDGKRIKVWQAIILDEYYPEKFNGEIEKTTKDGIVVKTSNSSILLTIIQPEGKAKMHSSNFINGQKTSLVGKIVG